VLGPHDRNAHKALARGFFLNPPPPPRKRFDSSPGRQHAKKKGKRKEQAGAEEGAGRAARARTGSPHGEGGGGSGEGAGGNRVNCSKEEGDGSQEKGALSLGQLLQALDVEPPSPYAAVGGAFEQALPPLPARLLANMSTDSSGVRVWPASGCKVGGVKELVSFRPRLPCPPLPPQPFPSSCLQLPLVFDVPLILELPPFLPGGGGGRKSARLPYG